MMRVLVPIADGVEEMEAVIVIDTLRRAKWDVVAAGLKDGPVTASRRVRIIPDLAWEALDTGSFDMIVIPGGAAGVRNLKGDRRVLDAIREFDAAGKWTAAICAGPLVLQEAGILDGRKATCHPAEADRLTSCTRVDQPVVVDGRLVTSQGAGTCFAFALELVRLVDGDEAARGVAAGMVCAL